MKKIISNNKVRPIFYKILEEMNFPNIRREGEFITFEVPNDGSFYRAILSVDTWGNGNLNCHLSVTIHVGPINGMAAMEYFLLIQNLNRLMPNPFIFWYEKENKTVTMAMLVHEGMPSKLFLEQWITLGTLCAMDQLKKLRPLLKEEVRAA